ncbi:MAG TPA: site-2 protease family protein [Steroidobacteraceae bacterium]|nr:site-2 protease family protein [Steroidobacteraceae bacterium]
MNFTVFITKISIWAIPVLFAITLHEVAHGWTARYFGDRTADLLGRLSLNPLRHIDPVGTVLVPGILLAFGGPLFGWAKPVPVSIRGLRNPRRSMIWVALAGPAANLVMAAGWCTVLGLVARLNGSLTVVGWVALMAQAGIVINVVLALFNLLPIPPLDGGRVLAGLLPPRLSTGLARVEPFGFLIVLGLTGFGLFGWLFDPAYRLVGQVIGLLIGNSA